MEQDVGRRNVVVEDLALVDTSHSDYQWLSFPMDLSCMLYHCHKLIHLRIA
jgi:hypothetical protein